MTEGWFSQDELKIHFYRPDPDKVIRDGAGSTSLCGIFWLNSEAHPVKHDIHTLDIKRACKTCIHKRHPILLNKQARQGIANWK